MWTKVKTYADLVAAAGDGPFMYRRKQVGQWSYGGYADPADMAFREFDGDTNPGRKLWSSEVYPIPEEPKLEWLVEEEDGEIYRNRYHYTTEAGPHPEQEARVTANGLESQGRVKPKLFYREVGPWRAEGE